jgi:hypothetical protein
MVTVANETSEIVLTMQDLREVTSYAAESAQEVLEIFERAHPADSRPRDAIDAAWTFARGGERGKTLRDTAWAAHKAARDADTAAAGDAARAAMCAASAAYLHPLADEDEITRLVERDDRQRQKLDDLVDDYAADLLTRDQFARAKTTAGRDQDKTREELGKLQHHQAIAQLGPGQTVTRAWESADLHWRLAVIQLVVDRVIVHPGHTGMHVWRGYRFDPNYIEIQWKK